MYVSGLIMLILYQKKGCGWFRAPPDLKEIDKMEDWMDKEISTIINVDYDELTGEFTPLITIGDKIYSWDDFGRELQTYEGWQLKFKIVDPD
jgi:hypothetical protein